MPEGFATSGDPGAQAGVPGDPCVRPQRVEKCILRISSGDGKAAGVRGCVMVPRVMEMDVEPAATIQANWRLSKQPASQLRLT